MLAKLRSRACSWRVGMDPFRFFKQFVLLAVPNCLSFASELVVPFSAVIFLGKMSTSEMQGACLLGNMYSNAFGNALIFGLAMGLDSLAPQAEGSGKKALVGLYCQRGLLISLLACVPIAVLWIFASPVLQFVFRIDAAASDLAQGFVVARLPGLPAIAAFEVFRRFAQAQRLAWPTLVACSVSALFHLGITYLLILKFGLVGAGYAISASQWVMLIVLICVLFLLRNSDSLAGSWIRPSLKELFGGWPQYLRVAGPASLSLAIEWGAWEVYASLSAQLGTVALASHSIMATTSAIFYIFPLGCSQAVATLVGNYLGEGNAKNCQSCLLLGYGCILSFTLVNASLSLLYRDYYPWLFSNDPAVVKCTAGLFGMFFVYTLFDCMKAIGMASLRSTGRPTVTMIGVLLAQVIVGYPVSLLLRPSNGVEGVWWGSTSAWGTCAIVFFVLLFFTDWENEVEKAQHQVKLGLLSREQQVEDRSSGSDIEDVVANEEL